MSVKMTRPACGTHSSRVGMAYERWDECPECGLLPDVTREVLAARRVHADEKLKAAYEKVVIEMGRVTAERDELRARLGAAQEAVGQGAGGNWVRR